MAQVPPYHTDSTDYAARQREVYHDRDDCPAGRQIKPWHRHPGTAERPRCRDCAKLG